MSDSREIDRQILRAMRPLGETITDPEIDALSSAYVALRRAEPEAWSRMLTWLREKLEADRRSILVQRDFARRASVPPSTEEPSHP